MSKRILINMSVCLLAFLIGMMLASITARADQKPGVRPYVAFSLASRHIGTSQDFNERNPGIGLGLAFALPHGGELSPEVGLYRNSFSKRSVYAAVTYDMAVARLSETTELRLGGFAGLVHYPGETKKFRDNGAIMVGDAVLLAGISATLRHDDRTDLRMRIMPGGAAAKALVTLQLGIRF